jgi:hypothetical protein
MNAYRTGLMVIRVWVEEGSSEPLRAQIRHTSDIGAGFTGQVSFTHSDSVLEEVGAFLKSMSESGA